MPAQPLLSICIPTFNRYPWLRISLAALAPQIAAFGDTVELIVSDNCSTDNSATLVQEMQGVCSIHFHRNSENIGANQNISLLVSKLARGEFVWVIGDDDIVRPDGVKRILQVLQDHRDIDYLYLNYTRWSIIRPPDFPLLPQDLPGIGSIGGAEVQPKYLQSLSEIAAGDFACFTPIYCSVFRKSEAEKAYWTDPQVPPFSTLASICPHAVYIVKSLLHKPAWYLGYPCVITTPPQGWDEYRPVFMLRHLPTLYAMMQDNGIPAEIMNGHRRSLLNCAHGSLAYAMTHRNLPFWKYRYSWDFLWEHRRFAETWLALLKTVALIIYMAKPFLLVRIIWRAFKAKKEASLNANRD